MRDDRVLLLGWCVALALLVAHTQSQSPPEPSWKCRVCEDAVQTWHDRFKCAGSSLSMEMQDPNSPEAGSKSMQACRQPTLDCNDLNEHLKPICKAMRYQFITRKQGEIWTMLMNKGNVYDTCIRMGKCINDTEQPDAHDCRLSFKNASCHSHLTCAPVEQHCSSRCFLCYHLVRDWPLFQQTCKPPGATIEQEAHPDEEKVLLSNGAKPSASFLQSSSAVAMGRAFSKNSYRKMLARQRARKQADEIDRLAGPFGAPVTPKDDRADYFDENFSFLQLSAAPYNPYNDRDDADAVAELKRRAQLAPVRAAAPAAGPGRGRGRAHRGRPSQKIPVMTETEAWTAAISQADGEAEAEATDENPVVPVQNSDTLPMQCHEMWDTIRYSKKCRFFVQFKTDVSILPGPKDLMAKQGSWDANIACKCLGYCELSKFENLGLADVCKFGQEEQQTMDILLAEYIREAPHKGISNEKEDEEEGGDDE